MRHLLAVILGIFLPSVAIAETPPTAQTGETAWLCWSRIGGRLPRIGRLFHASAMICPAGASPTVIGPDGRVISNPACTCYGSHPGKRGFQQEPNPRVDATAVPATVPAEQVRYRVLTDWRRWRIWYNCQHAAAEVTGNPGARPSTR